MHTMWVIFKLQEGMTALHFAAMEGHVEILELLLKKGCNVNVTAGVCCFKPHIIILYRFVHYCIIPGKHPCTKFQWINVAASVYNLCPG